MHILFQNLFRKIFQNFFKDIYTEVSKIACFPGKKSSKNLFKNFQNVAADFSCKRQVSQTCVDAQVRSSDIDAIIRRNSNDSIVSTSLQIHRNTTDDKTAFERSSLHVSRLVCLMGHDLVTERSPLHIGCIAQL